MRASLMLLHVVPLFFAAGCDQQTATAPAVRLAEVRAAAGPEWGAWSNPVNVPVVNSDAQDNQPTLSPDQLSLYFASNRPGGRGGNDIWVARRASTSSAWGAPVNLAAPINTPANDQGPSLSRDGLLLFFHSNRPGGQGEQDIYVSRRMNKHDDFGWEPPANLGTDVNTSAFEAGPMFLQNAEEGRINFYFSRGPTQVDIDIYAATITRNGETRGPAVAVSELNSPVPGVTDARTTMRMDAKEIVFFSTRPGGFGLADLYVATRQSVHASWSDAINLGTPVNSQFIDTQPSLSFDGTTLLFSSNRPGGLGNNDIWMTTRSLRPGT